MNDPWAVPNTCRWQSGILKDGPEVKPLVVKFGGSLLRRADWPQLLRSLLEMRRGRAMAIIVGGGAAVDSIRRIDDAASLEPAISHRLSIDAMGITARLVADSIGWPLAASPPDDGSPCVFDVPAWLDASERFAKLPVGWHVTSDSIAAFVAVETGCDLLLAKSVPPPAGGSRDAASLTDTASAGWVDGWFPTVAAGLSRIEWAAPLSPTTNRRPAGRPAHRAAASRPRGSRLSSTRPPRAG